MDSISENTQFLEQEDIPYIVKPLRLSVQLLTLYYTLIVRQELLFSEKITSLSLLGFLPNSIIFNPYLFIFLKLLVIVSIVMWIFAKALPISCWTSFIGYFTLICFTVESQLYTKHMYHIVNVSLFAFLLWEISDTRLSNHKQRQSITDLPFWVYFIIIFYLSLGYTFSGTMKLYFSGIDWLDGIGLQVWVFTAASDGPLRSIIIENVKIASILQCLVLIAETLCILVLFYPRLRLFFGIILVGFHISVEIMADLQFYGNILIGTVLFIITPIAEYWAKHRNLNTKHKTVHT